MKLLVIVMIAILTAFAVDAGRVAIDRRDVNSVASDSADAGAQVFGATHDESKARIAADATARAHHMVITTFHYDPVAAKFNVTVSGSAQTLVLHYFDRRIVDLNASASARP